MIRVYVSQEDVGICSGPTPTDLKLSELSSLVREVLRPPYQPG